ncbi:interferon alpha-inducible protein 27-like protein 2A isoform X1 [Liolophura sinensis]|uniref:interferon alpha-inducible protein 27-like protein 2A isoform X1 n=2 Tax=Liolophura sinensis TaxID=3198878 RepID=UPI0031581DFA
MTLCHSLACSALNNRLAVSIPQAETTEFKMGESKKVTAVLLVFLFVCPQGTSAVDGWDILKGAAIGGVSVAAAPLALGALGFTTGGVAAGSVAAAIQSSVYGGTVTAGSLFATAQSVGAVGVTTSAVVLGAVAGAAKKASDDSD